MCAAPQETAQVRTLIQLSLDARVTFAAVLTGAVVELPVRDFSFHVTSAFNDLSLHIFPAAKLVQAGLPP